jgi:fatty-acyl-CoA synthase
MAGVRNFLVRGSLGLALLMPFYFLAAALATRFELVDWRLGFVSLTLFGGVILVVVTGLAALVGLILALALKPRQGWQRALVALAIPIVGVGGVLSMMWGRSGATVRIHDIVTDRAAPLALSPRVMAARARVPGVNPVEADPRVGPGKNGKSVREIQRAVYPDIQPIELRKQAAEVFEQALATARKLGWNVEYSDAAAGRIEATVRTFWYGFTDDVAIQVAPTDQGTRIDLRSISRVGEGDAGANAARVRGFREAISTG